MGRKPLDLSGQTFGHWTVLHRDGYLYGKSAAFMCRCACGTTKRLAGHAVKGGKTTNCGCVPRRELGDRARKHGKHTHHLYGTWRSMRERCRSPSHDAYHRYGGRGITVCPRWDDFDLFLADMEPTWRPGLTLDRQDNDGPYSPENCRWATRKQQTRNSTSVRNITYRGETKPICDWAAHVGISSVALQLRLRAGWPLERAIAPYERKRRK